MWYGVSVRWNIYRTNVSEYKWCQLATDSQVSQETIIDKLVLITSSYYEIILRFGSFALNRCPEQHRHQQQQQQQRVSIPIQHIYTYNTRAFHVNYQTCAFGQWQRQQKENSGRRMCILLCAPFIVLVGRDILVFNTLDDGKKCLFFLFSYGICVVFIL